MKLALALAACLCLAGLWWIVPRTAAPAAEGLAPPTPSVASEHDIARPDVEALDPGPARVGQDRTVVAESKTPVLLAAKAVRSPSFPRAGRLEVSAVDALTGAPLDRIRVRVLNDSRIADRESDPGSQGIGLALTPGEYAVLVMVRGYEPAELPAVRIVSGETVTLPPTSLRPGSARIVGTVVGRLERGKYDVELWGAARRPCPSCAQADVAGDRPMDVLVEAWQRNSPCAACGYAQEFSRRSVARNGTFTWENLSAAPYALRLVDGNQRTIGMPIFVQVQAAESVEVRLDAGDCRNVLVEMIDTDGTSLASEWAANVRASVQASERDDDFLEVVVIETDGVSAIQWACDFRADERSVARAVLQTPVRPGHPSTAIGFARGVSGYSAIRIHDDRARDGSEALRPQESPPSVTPSNVTADVGPDGLARFGAVPTCDLVLEMRTDHYTATIAVPASRGTSRVTASVVRLDEAGFNTNSVPSTFRAFDADRYRQ